MAQKFGNFRWVKEGFLDGRGEDVVVGCITFAALGPVEFCLKGKFTGQIAGKIIRFQNSQFVDDPQSAESLADFEIPQVGTASLLSFDPHPLLPPHPYFEWFSLNEEHYRIELAPGDAWIVEEDEAKSFDTDSHLIRTKLRNLLQASEVPHRQEDWF
jgi:hypothetical protein